jgi:serine phosphatase RsbU (regulator of sigma subunit)/tetratricopeptide (TPR) repeat protein
MQLLSTLFFRKILQVFLFLCCSFISFGQSNDSLWNIWMDESETDSVRLKAIHDHAWFGYLFTQPDSAAYFMDLQYEYADKTGQIFYKADAMNVKGISLYFRGELDSAIVCYEESIKEYQKINHKVGLAKVIMNLGSVYLYKGDYAKTIENYTKSLRLQEIMGDTLGQAQCLSNIGTVYLNQREFEDAGDYYDRAIELYGYTEDRANLATCINNVGIIYFEQGDYDTAKKKYHEALAIREEINNPIGIAGSINNLALVEYKLGNFELAEEYYTQALDVFKASGDKFKEVTAMNGLGQVYVKRGKRALALKTLEDALKMSEEFGFASEIKNAAFELYILYKENQPRKALEMHELYLEMRDSIDSEEGRQEILKQKFKYEYEKQAAADSVGFAKEKEIAAVQMQKQEAELNAKRNQQYAMIGGLILIAVFAGFMYNRFQLTKRQKGIIEEQKEKVDMAFLQLEEKNGEIMDSINYAKRIQAAILPTVKAFKAVLPDSFVLYEPKDIVAGDFYWLESVPDKPDEILLAAADCTGHGVPGAMVSVICNNGLNRSVREHNLTDPGQILDKTRELVIQEFSKSEDEVKDGMDIALIAIKDKTLRYAGAHNPLWIARNGEIIEIKANKQPIGNFEHVEPYKTHEVQLEEGDSVYIFTDGFVDQFGGDKGKKFKPSNFRKALLAIQDKTMAQQKQLLFDQFETWRGSLEQVDDICVIGVRI